MAMHLAHPHQPAREAARVFCFNGLTAIALPGPQRFGYDNKKRRR
jgi:hypothetical protein